MKARDVGWSGIVDAAVIAVALVACTAGEAPGDDGNSGHLRITRAWIRAAPPTATAFAGYFTIENTGSKTVAVTSVRSPRFQRITLHRTVVEGNIARMIPEPSLLIPPAAIFEFAPGGWHLMMFEPVQPVEEGERIEIVLRDAEGAESRFLATVQREGGN